MRRFLLALLLCGTLHAQTAVFGRRGPAGPPPKLTVGPTSTVAPSLPASVTIDGAGGAYTLTFALPAGQPGEDGPPGNPGLNGTNGQPGAAATISVGSVNTGAAAVTNSGTPSAAVLNFTLPQGVAGTNGVNGANAASPTFTATATPLTASSTPTVGLVGSYPNLALSFGIPAGQAGTSGTNAPSPVFSVTATGLAAGATPTVGLSGTYPAQALAFGIPAGAQGIQGNPGTQGAPGVLLYGASGALTNMKCWIGPVTSTATGNFSVSIATAGITTLKYVNPSVGVASATAAGAYNAYILNSSTATTINGIVTQPHDGERAWRAGPATGECRADGVSDGLRDLGVPLCHRRSCT